MAGTGKKDTEVMMAFNDLQLADIPDETKRDYGKGNKDAEVVMAVNDLQLADIPDEVSNLVQKAPCQKVAVSYIWSQDARLASGTTYSDLGKFINGWPIPKKLQRTEIGEFYHRFHKNTAKIPLFPITEEKAQKYWDGVESLCQLKEVKNSDDDDTTKAGSYPEPVPKF